VMWIKAVINVTPELVGAMKPWASSDEHTAVEPLGPVVPIWGACVWGVVVVAIRASRLWPDIDGDLGRCRPRDTQKNRNQGKKGKDFPIAHKLLLTLETGTPDTKNCNNWKSLKFKEGWVRENTALKWSRQ
jgi:hypothetical protein